MCSATRRSLSAPLRRQAMMKARRSEDPRNYALVEEVCVEGPTSSLPPGEGGRVERRVLPDDECVYRAQQLSDGAKFVLTERRSLQQVRGPTPGAGGGAGGREQPLPRGRIPYSIPRHRSCNISFIVTSCYLVVHFFLFFFQINEVSIYLMISSTQRKDLPNPFFTTSPVF